MTDFQEIRRLSDDVLAIAQAARGHITDEGHSRLLDAGLALRSLAGLPPPWDDQEEKG